MKLFHKLLFIILLTIPSLSWGQNNALRISLVTCYPGPQTYELYGHSAIRVQYGIFDLVYNYGIFNFSEPNFTYRFVKGNANYLLAAYGFDSFIAEYRNRNSKVVEQVLNLSPEKAQLLYSLLEENARPENREYRYDYILDNCSTRPRDIIERTIGTSLSYPTPADANLTFRDIMHHYDANYSWQEFGIDLALGGGLDYKLTNREQMFAPIFLQHALATATYVDSTGTRIPLVSNTFTLNPGSDLGAIDGPTPWYITPTAFACVLLLITIAISIFDLRRDKISRWYDSLIYLIYALGGCLIYFLIFESLHAATSPNLVGLWLSPFYIIPAIFIWIKRTWKFLYFYQMINFVVLLVTISFWWAFPQVGNTAFYPLILIPAVREINFIIIFHRCAKRGK